MHEAGLNLRTQKLPHAMCQHDLRDACPPPSDQPCFKRPQFGWVYSTRCRWGSRPAERRDKPPCAMASLFMSAGESAATLQCSS